MGMFHEGSEFTICDYNDTILSLMVLKWLQFHVGDCMILQLKMTA